MVGSTPQRFAFGCCILLAVASSAVGRGGTDSYPIALEQAVSNGVPGPGAGNIERPGAIDTYQLTIPEPMSVYFSEDSGGCSIVWSCVSPSGVPIFTNDPLCVGDPGVKVLLETGIYTITATSTNGTGTYGFTVWALNAPETFTLAFEQTVSNGVPGPGAGMLEEPGAIDRYELDVVAPQIIYVDEINGNCSMLLKGVKPSGGVLFAPQPICVGDPGSLLLTESGTYVFEVSGSSGTTGSYSFKIWTVEPPQVFPVSIGQTVSSGVPGPGAGVLEEPGSIDRYELTITSATNVFFDELNGNCSITWTCRKPDASTLFPPSPICVGDPGQFLLLDVGTYEIEVQSGTSSAFGPYSFRLVEVQPPQFFAITVGTTISDGVPAPGAGNLEAPASIDIYTFEANVGDAVCFLDGNGNCSIRWRLVAPTGAVIFDDSAVCVGDPGTFVLPDTGTYQVVVYGVGSASGPYSIAVLPSRTADLDGDCHVTAPDLAILLGAWGTCVVPCPADLNGDGSVDATDLATLLGEWG